MLTRIEIAEIGRYISAQFGIQVAENNWFELEKKLLAASLHLNYQDFRTFTSAILNHSLSQTHKELLATYLTVGETYFFREKGGLDIFMHQILPGVLKNKKPGCRDLRIWSAGCCTGEEPYTLAILLEEIKHEIKDWKIHIHATDLNRNYIDKALSGTYSQWSFRETPEWIRKKYFTHDSMGWRLLPEIRDRVSFSVMNLLDPDPSFYLQGSQDVIFCRNVLMYFQPEQVRKVASHFQFLLDENGWLITSPVEVSNAGLESFVYIPFSGWGALRKKTASDDPLIRIPQVQMEAPGKTILPGRKRISLSKARKPAQNGVSIAGELDNPVPKRKIPFHSLENDSLESASMLFQNGAYSQAIPKLEKWLETDSSNPGVFKMLIQSHLFTGSQDRALSFCLKAAQIFPEDPVFLYLAGSIYFDSDQLKEAETALRQTLYVNQEYFPAHLMLGNLLLGKGDKKAAGRHFRSLLQLLKDRQEEEVLPELDGMTVKHVTGIVNQFLNI